jgi:ribosomal protein L16 Arg81 hydroxylase
MPGFDAEVLLRSMIGGMAVDAFNLDIRESRATKFDGAISAEHVDELFSLSRLESLITREATLGGYIDLFDAGNLRRFVDVQRKSGKSSLEVVLDSLRRGDTVRIRDVDQFDSRLRCFAREVGRVFAAQSDINVYLTPPAQSGFDAHFDTTDVFIVQCRGSKEWRVFRDYTNRAALPLTDTNWDPDRFRPSADFEVLTLCAGDVLYLPRGTMHQAFCSNRESMHLTVSIAPLTYADILVKAVKRAAETDSELRRRVPWPIGGEDAGYESLACQVREQLRKLPNQVDVGALLNEAHRSLRAEPAATAGALESVITSLGTGAIGDLRGLVE